MNYKEIKVFDPKRKSSYSKYYFFETRMSCGTVSKIIHQDLKLKKMFKPKGHLLWPKHIIERKSKCRNLHEKWKFVVTLNEAWVYFSDCNKKIQFSIVQLRGMAARNGFVIAQKSSRNDS